MNASNNFVLHTDDITKDLKVGEVTMQTLRGNHIENLPSVLGGWKDTRDFPPFSGESFRDWWKKNRT